MNRNILIITLLLCIAFVATRAQQNPVVSREVYANVPNFAIGKDLPDFGISKLINADEATIKGSDFNDRLLILDFWGTTCGTCIEALPHMVALQKQFGDRVKIIPVTTEKEAYIKEWWKNNKLTKKLSLPSIVEGKNYFSFFQCTGIPHEIWIYKGKIIGITSGEYVDAFNIGKVLSGKIPDWPVKNDFYRYDNSKPLFKSDPKQVDITKTFIKYAAIADYKEKDGASLGRNSSGIVKDSSHRTIRSYLVNNSIYSAYAVQWSKLIDLAKILKPNSRQLDKTILWEVSDRSRYIYSTKFNQSITYEGDWMRKNAFCFESLNPDTGQTDQMIAKSVISDLNRLLGLSVRWEKRKEKVLVLVKTGRVDKLKSKTDVLRGDQFHNAPERETRTGTLSQFRGYPLPSLLWELNQQENNPYVYDETGYTGAVDMDLDFSSWTDIAGLRKSLLVYGLDLKEQDRLVDRFVITEVNGSLLIDGQMQADAKAMKLSQTDMKGPSIAENNSFLELNKTKKDVVVLPSGLQYKVLNPGNGNKPALGDKVKVKYTGTLVNGKIFDTSFSTGKPAEVNIDNNRIIDGWVEALQLMPVGSKWMLYVPSSLAYGERTGHGAVPPNSNLVFELELLNIVK